MTPPYPYTSGMNMMVCVLVYEREVGVDPSLLYTSGMNMMVCVLVYEGEVGVDPSWVQRTRPQVTSRRNP